MCILRKFLGKVFVFDRTANKERFDEGTNNGTLMGIVRRCIFRKTLNNMWKL